MAGEEKSEGDRGKGVEERRGERKRSTTVSQIETYSSRFAVSLLFSNSNFSLFFSCFSALDVVGPRWSWNRESAERENEFYYTSRSRQSNLASFHRAWSVVMGLILEQFSARV